MGNPALVNIRRMTSEEILHFLKNQNEPHYRLTQLWEWLWIKNESNFVNMSNLGKNLQNHLCQHFHIPTLQINQIQYSKDGTIKTALKTPEGYLLESVIIPVITEQDRRITLCVSSQIGCDLNCSFCATARMNKKRNLFFDEIWDQFMIGNQLAQKHFHAPITNIVFMGMGEPLLNYHEVLKAINLITHPEQFYSHKANSTKTYSSNSSRGMSPKRITLSTAGIAKKIKQLGDDGVTFELALSLHAATDDKRSKIMMNNAQNNLSKLRDALHYFYQKTKNKITLEYLLLKDINDSIEDAKHLIRFYRQIPAKLVNIIQYNPVTDLPYQKPNEMVFDRFVNNLERHKINVRTRRSRGKDIDAACGQLANIFSKENIE